VLSYENLYNAPVEKLKVAADEWATMIRDLERLEDELVTGVVNALPLSGWIGDDARSASSFIGETRKEFADAVQEATGIRNILSQVYTELYRYRRELHEIENDAPAAGFRVTSNGQVEPAWPEPQHMIPSTWRGKRTHPEAQQDFVAQREAIAKGIVRARAAASDAEEAAAEALKVNLKNEAYNFNPPTHVTLRSTQQAVSERNFRHARDFTYDEMMRNLKSDEFKKIKDATGLWKWPPWFEQVAPNHVWDHKPELARRYGLETADDFYFKTPSADRTISYEIWSNLHYGYVGAAAEIPGNEVMAQSPFWAGDTDEGDNLIVRAGTDMWDKYGAGLTREQFYGEVDKTIDDLWRAKAPQVKPWPP
jgi:hypothetical protein